MKRFSFEGRKTHDNYFFYRNESLIQMNAPLFFIVRKWRKIIVNNYVK